MNKPFAVVYLVQLASRAMRSRGCRAPTETDFFERADMLDTKVGQGKKDDPADVARVGFDAMMRGDDDVVSGWKNKLRSAIVNVTQAGVLGEQHPRMAEPGSAEKANE